MRNLSHCLLVVVILLPILLIGSQPISAQEDEPQAVDQPTMPKKFHADLTAEALEILPKIIQNELKSEGNRKRVLGYSLQSVPAVVAGSYIEDTDILHGIPNYHHSWNPESNDYWRTAVVPGSGDQVGTALDWADHYFRRALEQYSEGDQKDAYITLGRLIHLLGDMATPAHVHLDEHIDIPKIHEDGDSYESHLDHYPKKPNKGWPDPLDYRAVRTETPAELKVDGVLAAYNDTGGVSDSSADILWRLGPKSYSLPGDKSFDGRVDPDLFHIFYSMAEHADDFSSDDVAGDMTGPPYDLTDLNKQEIILVSLCVERIGAVIQLFWDRTHPAESTVGEGLFFLRQQQYEDGSWSNSVGITSMATLAFLNEGYSELDPAVANGIRYLINNVHSDGTIYSYRKNYETSLAIITLKATRNDAYTDEIEAAKEWLLQSQWDEDSLWGSVNEDNWYYGGFGYGSHSRPDLSNTQFSLLALDAADVPKSDPAWGKAVRFVSRSQNRQASNDGFSPYDDGGFIYYPGGCWSPGCVSYGSMTGAGIWGFALAGLTTKDARFKDALDWVEDNYTWEYNPTTGGSLGSQSQYYYYLSMSKALSMARKTKIGGFLGNGAHDWYEELNEKLVELQREDGSWINPSGSLSENNPNLATSYALLALQTRRLPKNADLEMAIILHSPADIHLYDVDGRHVGKNYVTGSIDLEIPGSNYSDGDPQTITINPPIAGNYHLQLVGTGKGQWEVEIIGYQDGVQVSHEMFEGKIVPDEILASDLNVGAFEGGFTIFSSVPEETAVMAVDPVNLTVVGQPGEDSTTTITMREIGEKVAVEDVTVFATDFYDDLGNTIPAEDILIDPTAFGIKEGGKRKVTVTIPVPDTKEFTRYTGSIVFESLNAGTRSTEIALVVNPGSITVVKETSSEDGTFAFTSSTLPQETFDLTTANGTSSITFENLANGTYDLTESPVEGWVLVSATCDDGSSPDAIEIDPNESVTCTFLNSKTGKITIKKRAPEGSDKKFRFSGDLGTFGLSHQETRVFENLAAGEYMVVEQERAGWRMESVDCRNADVAIAANGVKIKLDEGEKVLCTFLNSPADFHGSIFMPMVSGQ